MRKDEYEIQKALVKYLKLQYPDVLFLGTQNGVYKSVQAAAKAKAAGMQKGIPDLLVLTPNTRYFGLALEVKTKTGVLSKEQKEWLASLNAIGWYAVSAKGFENCKNIIDDYCKDM